MQVSLTMVGFRSSIFFVGSSNTFASLTVGFSLFTNNIKIPKINDSRHEVIASWFNIDRMIHDQRVLLL